MTNGKDPNQTVNPDEVVAVGAAIQTGVLGGVMTKLVERNTTIPVRWSEIFSTAEDNQTAVDIHILQGEREMARDNRTWGHFRLEGIRQAHRGQPQIDVSFDIDANGILTVTARDKDTDKEQTVTITGSTQLSKDEVNRMVRDAQANAADDHKRREEAEARNQLDTVAYQVENRLQELGDLAPVNEKARAQQLIQEARSILKANSSDLSQIRKLTRDLQQLAYGLTAQTTQTNGTADYNNNFQYRGGDGIRQSAGNRGFTTKGRDVEAELPLTLKEVHRGGPRHFVMDLPERCPACGGAGINQGKTCPSCKGSKYIKKRKQLEVNIPAGVREGAVIRLAGLGRPGTGNGKPGDLYLKVKIKPDSLLAMVGADDLQLELPVAPWEAVLGAKVKVPTLEGTVEMTIPPGSQGGQRLRLRGQGLKRRDGTRGDQYVKLKINVPATSTEKERELYSTLARESRFDPRSAMMGGGV